MDKLVAAVSRRVNPGGQKEVTVRPFGLDQIEVILPEVEQEEVEQIKRIISSAGVLEFRIVANRADPRAPGGDRRSGEVPRARTVRQDGRAIGRWVRDRPRQDAARRADGHPARPGEGDAKCSDPGRCSTASTSPAAI